MAEGTYSTLEIDATPEELYDVVADVAAYPEWASGVKQVEVLEEDAEGRVSRARFVLEGFVKEINYVLEYTHDRPNSLTWVAVESDDLDMLEGSYQFAPTESGATEVVYSLTVAPNFTIPGFIKRQAEKQIVTTALRGLRKRVARGG
ncbi:MAG TPA: SRPBCC family protein [Acidimicrobiia bacterium]|jgi:ribosome-associated toxin RatA of RatAB toxin-antitoxin module|nr:SRPBCC family protein [Acidimicrobiia bacterium]